MREANLESGCISVDVSKRHWSCRLGCGPFPKAAAINSVRVPRLKVGKGVRAPLGALRVAFALLQRSACPCGPPTWLCPISRQTAREIPGKGTGGIATARRASKRSADAARSGATAFSGPQSTRPVAAGWSGAPVPPTTNRGVPVVSAPDAAVTRLAIEPRRKHSHGSHATKIFGGWCKISRVREVRTASVAQVPGDTRPRGSTTRLRRREGASPVYDAQAARCGGWSALGGDMSAVLRVAESCPTRPEPPRRVQGAGA